MSKAWFFVSFTLVAFAFIFNSSPAFSEGSIKGKVTFSGKVPAPKEFSFSKFPNTEFCKKNPNKSADGNTRLLKEVEVDGSKGLKNAVVSVMDIENEDWMNQFQSKSAQEVVTNICEFKPFTGVAVSKGLFKVTNLDADPDDPKFREGVLHNMHSFDNLGAKSSTEFNIGLNKKGDSLEKLVKLKMSKKGSVLRLQCDQHEFMQGWFLPVRNRHYKRVESDGSFEINGIPKGKHKIIAWHPIAGKVLANVEVEDGKTIEVKLDIE